MLTQVDKETFFNELRPRKLVKVSMVEVGQSVHHYYKLGIHTIGITRTYNRTEVSYYLNRRTK